MTEATTSERLQACENLLSQAYLSYVRHEEGQREPFNLFTVLRSESDEVRLHSRFLAALLDHRKAPGEPRKNLKHFLKDIVGCSDFDLNGVMVERERDNIDILVSNTARQAVVIENKIWAGDQPEQLKRYHESLRERGFEDKNIHLLYLTPHGHDPSEDSRDDLDVVCISYEQTLPSWLEGCRQRACDEPELRESVAQYLHLVRKLTGTDRGREYMNELKKFWKADNNLALSYDLGRAAIEAKLDLFNELFEDISKHFSERCGRPCDDTNFIKHNGWGGSSYVAISWNLTGKYENKASLCVFTDEAHTESLQLKGGSVYLCVWCDKEEDPDAYEEIKEALKSAGAEHHHGSEWGWRPWCRYPWDGLTLRNPSREYIEMLSEGTSRRELAEKITDILDEAWQTVHAST